MPILTSLKKSARKSETRKITTELAWLHAMGIERDHSVPLYAGQSRTGKEFKP